MSGFFNDCCTGRCPSKEQYSGHIWRLQSFDCGDFGLSWVFRGGKMAAVVTRALNPTRGNIGASCDRAQNYHKANITTPGFLVGTTFARARVISSCCAVNELAIFASMLV
eukprot:GHVU01188905.1.p1 GENE.GHVU01188905.1~~GHVU01188905.1.p1  ORF type:complete len:110 (+),score=0.30 GHVU01188905.1:241-570(+)